MSTLKLPKKVALSFKMTVKLDFTWLLFAIDIILFTTRKRDGILMSRDKVPGVDYPDVKTETRKVVGTTFLDLTQ